MCRIPRTHVPGGRLHPGRGARMSTKYFSFSATVGWAGTHLAVSAAAVSASTRAIRIEVLSPRRTCECSPEWSQIVRTVARVVDCEHNHIEVSGTQL